ncbi:MAG: ABC transporter substrate-binding protein [Thermodesulfobacteriota bacterium]|nr:ABC transporter substrate-binding protein [Thermodesulfobacteriota bacterium]
MKKLVLIGLLLVMWVPLPCLGASTYHIEELQVGDVTPFDSAYKGFVDELARKGMVEGKNLTINRNIIEADPEAGFWKKIGILLQIKKKASEIVDKKPDLVFCIGTPATEYSHKKIINAGIPMVFTMVVYPEQAGCKSNTEPADGLTGTSIYMDPYDSLGIMKLVLPDMKKLGIIHSDEDNAVAFTEELRQKAGKLGVEVVDQQVDKSDRIGDAVNALIKQGVDTFGIPIDSYYGLRDSEPVKDLQSIANENKIPVVSFLTHSELRGAILYVGCDFQTVGGLSADQGVKILKDGIRPENIPIARQEDLSILVDMDSAKRLGIEIPISILELARQVGQ